MPKSIKITSLSSDRKEGVNSGHRAIMALLSPYRGFLVWDGLEDHERVEAWKAAWKVSFDGWAIVERDFVFRAVNEKWLRILNVLPSNFVGQSFEDITPPEVLQMDLDNANLVIEGRINSYLIHKKFRFKSGEVRNIVALVVRVPEDTKKDFQFFLIRVLLDEIIEDTTADVTEKEVLVEKPADVFNLFKNIIGFGLLVGSIIAAIFWGVKP